MCVALVHAQAMSKERSKPPFDGRCVPISKRYCFPWNAFPPYIEWAIAYGSAVFPQFDASSSHVCNSGSTEKTNDVFQITEDCKTTQMKQRGPLRSFFAFPDEVPCRDYLLLVPRKDILVFHRENLARNPTHYALPFRIAGPSYACSLQQAGRGVEVFYNTLLCLDHGDAGKKLSKYGVATVEDFRAELRDWSSLFFSGRLHKPVQFYSPKGVPVESARFWPHLEENRLNAIRAALFLHLGEALPVKTLLTTICGLSYTGDIRVGVAENPRKLENMVVSQAVELLSVYYRLLTTYFPQLRISGSSIASSGIERLCGKLRAGCFGETNVTGVRPETSESDNTLAPMRPSCIESTWTADDRALYEALREDVIGGRLLLRVPHAQEGKRFRVSLLEALPPSIQEDVWKRVRRRTQREHSSVLGTATRLIRQATAFQENRLITQDPMTMVRNGGQPTNVTAHVFDNDPLPADLRASLTSVVRRSSAIIALKSALAAGPSKMVGWTRHIPLPGTARG